MAVDGLMSFPDILPPSLRSHAPFAAQKWPWQTWMRSKTRELPMIQYVISYVDGGISAARVTGREEQVKEN